MQTFDDLTKSITASLPGYQFKELKVSDGEIERSWTGNDESITIVWRRNDYCRFCQGTRKHHHVWGAFGQRTVLKLP